MKKYLAVLLSAIFFFQINVLQMNCVRFNRTRVFSRQDKIKATKEHLPEYFLRFHLKPPKKNLLIETQNNVMECEAVGSPPPVLHWLKDGRVYFTENQTNPSETDDNSTFADNIIGKVGISTTVARLYLDCVNFESSGKYTCVAENTYLRISAQFQVAVTTVDTRNVRTCSEKLRGKNFPRIYMWSKNKFEYTGRNAKLFCRTHGNPKPMIHWLAPENDNIGPDTRKYQVLSNGDLVIRNLEWSDMGTYICEATNIHGTDRQESFLYPTSAEE